MKTLQILLVLVSYAVYLDAVKYRCDYNFIGEGWFKYHKAPVPWRNARLICQSEGAMLASPTSPAIRQSMINSLNDGLKMYTGIHDTFSPGLFYSIDGVPLHEISHGRVSGLSTKYNGGERCLAMDSVGDFYDGSCTDYRPFACFKKYNGKSSANCGTQDPEYRYDSRTQKCYKFHTKGRQFIQAALVCNGEGGHLAIINSDVESRVLREIFDRYPSNSLNLPPTMDRNYAFIGFHHWYEQTVDFLTLHGQTLEEAGFNTWAANQPDNITTGEYCGSIYRNGLLNDMHCEKAGLFICEKDPGYPPLCD